MRRLGVALFLALMVSAPVAAHAEDSDYPGSRPPEVLGEQIEAAPSDAAVAPAAVQATGAVKAEEATLPFTGSDVTELTIIGIGLVGVGTVLVRRSRRRTPDAA